MSKEWRMFCLGVAFHAGFVTFYQDWHGMEGYIQIVRAHWVDLHWLVGVAICFAAWVYAKGVADK